MKYVKLFEDWDAPEEDWESPDQEDLSATGVSKPTQQNTWMITTSFTKGQDRAYPIQFTATNCANHKATQLIRGEWYMKNKANPILDPKMGAFMKRLASHGAQWITLADLNGDWFRTDGWEPETDPHTLAQLEELYQSWLGLPIPRDATHNSEENYNPI